MPEPTEKAILSQTLLSPSALPTIIDLKSFTMLFPPSLRNHPQIPLLYRDLQHQRNLDLDHVKENILEESDRGELQRRDVARARWRDAKGTQSLGHMGVTDEGEEREQDVENLLYGSSLETEPKAHSLGSIVAALELACTVLDEEVSELNSESEQLLEQLQATVGDLSDLRYGKFARPSLTKEVLASLRAVEAECDKMQD